MTFKYQALPYSNTKNRQIQLKEAEMFIFMLPPLSVAYKGHSAVQPQDMLHIS